MMRNKPNRSGMTHLLTATSEDWIEQFD